MEEPPARLPRQTERDLLASREDRLAGSLPRPAAQGREGETISSTPLPPITSLIGAIKTRIGVVILPCKSRFFDPRSGRRYIRDSMADAHARAYLKRTSRIRTMGGRIPWIRASSPLTSPKHAGACCRHIVRPVWQPSHAGTRPEASHRQHRLKSFAPPCAGLDDAAAPRSARRVPSSAMSLFRTLDALATAPRTPATGRFF